MSHNKFIEHGKGYQFNILITYYFSFRLKYKLCNFTFHHDMEFAMAFRSTTKGKRTQKDYTILKQVF